MGERLVIREHQGQSWAWPSLSFALRRRTGNTLRLEQPSGCPLALRVARRYWAVRWAGLGVGAWPMLELTLANRSARAVHSFTLRVVAGRGGHVSGLGCRPEGGILPDATFPVTSQEPETGCAAACVDFVQFVSGDTWYSQAPDALVDEAGVLAGSRAAADHLRGVLERADIATVMAQLASIHADVTEPFTRVHGPFGFYCGVTNLAVRLRHAFDRQGPNQIEAILRLGHPRD